MTTAYTSLLGLALPVTGELSGTWGDTVNNSITSLLDSAVAGTQTLTADTTLTTTTGAANQSRQAILLCSPASANITITAPAQSKIYTVINTSATYTVTVRGVGPTTGVTLGVSEKAVVAWNGSDFIKISNTAGAGAFTTLSVSGVATFSAGTAAAPAITTTGDTNTGIFFPAADTIAFAEGGAEAARFDSSGNFCLGTAAVLTSGKLSLQADLSAVNAMTLRDSGTTYGVSSYYTLYQNSAGSTVGGIGHTAITSLGINATTDLQFFTAATERARINSSGNFGLGVTPPTSTDAGNITIKGGSTLNFSTASGNMAANATFNSGWKYIATAAAVKYTQSGAEHQWFNAPSGTAGDPITFTQAMTLDASGNLGIGTSSPATKLHVANTGSSAVQSIRLENSEGYSQISTDSNLATYDAQLHLFNNRARSTEYMRIDSFGNVGIGTSSPTGKLNVVTDNTHNGGATFDSTGTTQIWMRDTNSTANTKNWGFQISGGDFNILRANDDRATGFVTPVSFAQAPANSLIIDVSGNVGIGTVRQLRTV
jgi:hypothetical protein